ncbi:hypothetical protein BU15DRAFT_23154, partial [Melanogaster broomeanus]
VPDGWSKHVHPQGMPYYLHNASKTYTQFDICNPEIQGDIEWYTEFLRSELSQQDPNLTDFELVIEPCASSNGEDVVCQYYFVNPTERCLFWLDDYQEPGFLVDCNVNSLSHKNLARLHWHRFPACHLVTTKLVRELKDLILYSVLDQLTEPRFVGDFTVTSAVGSTLEQLKNYISMLKDIDGMVYFQELVHHNHFPHTASKNKCINVEGQGCVQLHDDQTVPGWRYERSWCMVVAAPVLFMAPVTNIRSLHKLYVDHLVRMDKWTAFVNDFTSQLQNTNLLATVLLTTNVGFLAIQSVDSSTSRSVRQITSFLSIVCSIASIMLGSIFLERSRRLNSADTAAELLGRFYHAKHGLEHLALIFSLPYAYLMWGMTFFFVAFLAECYTVGNDILRVCLG